MEFVLADKSDIEELTRMRIAYIADEHNGISSDDEQVMRDNLPVYFERHLGKELFAFCAKEGSTVIATAFLLVIEKPSNPNFLNGLVGNVLNVYTVPEYRRKGISTRLMEDLIAFARENKLDLIELNATDEGHPLYKRLGFKDHESAYKTMRFVL